MHRIIIISCVIGIAIAKSVVLSDDLVKPEDDAMNMIDTDDFARDYHKEKNFMSQYSMLNDKKFDNWYFTKLLPKNIKSWKTASAETTDSDKSIHPRQKRYIIGRNYNYPAERDDDRYEVPRKYQETEKENDQRSKEFGLKFWIREKGRPQPVNVYFPEVNKTETNSAKYVNYYYNLLNGKESHVNNDINDFGKDEYGENDVIKRERYSTQVDDYDYEEPWMGHGQMDEFNKDNAMYPNLDNAQTYIDLDTASLNYPTSEPVGEPLTTEPNTWKDDVLITDDLQQSPSFFYPMWSPSETTPFSKIAYPKDFNVEPEVSQFYPSMDAIQMAPTDHTGNQFVDHPVSYYKYDSDVLETVPNSYTSCDTSCYMHLLGIVY